jgi:transposase
MRHPDCVADPEALSTELQKLAALSGKDLSSSAVTPSSTASWPISSDSISTRRALVLCVDEKSQIQALNRTQPALPLCSGLPARMTHDYTRHGTTSLFAALEVANGKVHARCFRRHRHHEFVAFLESLARRYPRLELHIICDNYGTHKHAEVQHWLVAHPRFHLHFTPTSASWLNLVERWFALITTQAIRRGSYDSVARLEQAIMRWLGHWNLNAQPFRWTRSAAEIKRSLDIVTAIYEMRH